MLAAVAQTLSIVMAANDPVWLGCSFREKLGGLSEGLSTWEKMEDECNRVFRASVDAALQQSLHHPAAGSDATMTSYADL